MAKKKTKKDSSKKPKVKLSVHLNDRFKKPLAIFFIFLVIIGVGKFGFVGECVYAATHFVCGYFNYLLYILIILECIYYLVNTKFIPYTKYFLSCTLITFGLLIILSGLDESVSGFHALAFFLDCTGGFLGNFLYSLLSFLFAFKGTMILAAILIICGCIISGLELFEKYGYLLEGDDDEEFEIEIPDISKAQKEKKPKKTVKQEEKVAEPKTPFFELFGEDDDDEMAFQTLPKKEKKEEEEITVPTPSLSQVNIGKDNPNHKIRENYSDYQFPPITLLNAPVSNDSANQSKNFAKENGIKLKTALQEFGVKADISNIYIGPTVIKYELTLETGTKVNQIKNLHDDIQLALATKDIRIEAPIPGKSAVGIEIPNTISTTVTFREIMAGCPKDDNKLLIPLGKDVMGNLIFMKLNEMPHLLIAGATGSGKSVCINTIICSILMKTRPDEVKLLLVDPKKVELANYDGIAHLLRPVVTDPKKASVALRTIVEEMENRYELFAKYNVRNMAKYNEVIKLKKLEDPELEDDVIPYIVVILDELADLMMVASKDVEDCIMRITQMARAAGIHLIVATQRPSTDVITGVIKANIPSRIAFAVSSGVDSRTILDTTGAEKLLGRGDMLYSPMGVSSPARLQGAFVSDEEVNRIVEYVLNQKKADYDDKFVNLEASTKNSGYDDEDEEYEDCRDFVIRTQKASASMLQRQFHIGYNKAARIMDQLEANGVIGPQIGSKPREVYIRGYHEEDI